MWFAQITSWRQDVHALYRILSSGERYRAAQFHFEAHRLRFVAARAFLRILLGSYLGRPPEALEFIYGSKGKPALHGDPIYFSVSHSHDRALFAFSPAKPLGVDIECVRPIPDLTGISERFFAPCEVEALSAFPFEGRADAFFRCWTRKEAFIKATGEGLSCELDRFAVSLDEPARLLQVYGNQAEADQWSLHHLAPEIGYVGAVAIRQRGLRLFNFSFPAI